VNFATVTFDCPAAILPFGESVASDTVMLPVRIEIWVPVLEFVDTGTPYWESTAYTS
jgi:hypothetical protein